MMNWLKKGIPMKTQYPSLSTKEYDNSPRGHTTLLKHYLQKMCEKSRRRAAKFEEDGAEIDYTTTSALATKEPNDQRERALKDQKDGADLDTILLKDLRLSRRSKTIKD
ncbi:hypothetical protein RDI58_004195 [Solanum bulbocastanum]|uniref:Uncharacterized protein n=1 Tax=Solanum bulbocastanum TaxID=147425 RepID=A0AAN8YJX1_SOLBU